MSGGRTTTPASPMWARLRGGGPTGNEALTTITAVLLLGLLAAEGVTIVRTGHRLVRYYTGSEPYVSKGPPELVLRVLGPLVVLTSVAVLGTGVWMLVAGPSSRPTVLPLHRYAFFAWLAVMSVHVLGHLPGIPAGLRIDFGAAGGRVRGRSARLGALLAATAVGLALALLLEPLYGAWLHGHFHHFHHFG